MTSSFKVHVRMSWCLCANGISYELEIVIVLLDIYYQFFRHICKIKKVIINFVVSVLLSALLHGSTQLPLNGFYDI